MVPCSVLGEREGDTSFGNDSLASGKHQTHDSDRGKWACRGGTPSDLPQNPRTQLLQPLNLPTLEGPKTMLAARAGN